MQRVEELIAENEALKRKMIVIKTGLSAVINQIEIADEMVNDSVIINQHSEEKMSDITADASPKDTITLTGGPEFTSVDGPIVGKLNGEIKQKDKEMRLLKKQVFDLSEEAALLKALEIADSMTKDQLKGELKKKGLEILELKKKVIDLNEIAIMEAPDLLTSIDGLANKEIKQLKKQVFRLSEELAILKAPKFTRIDSLSIADRRKWLIKVIMVIRYTFREYFGLEYSNQCGHFLDNHMCQYISDYSYYVAYSKGDLTLDDHFGFVYSAVMSSDGRFLYTGSRDKSIIKYDMSGDTLIRKWKADDVVVGSMTYHRSGLLISGGAKSIRIWNALNNDELVRTLEGHTDSVRSVNLNNDETLIISGSQDNTLRLWSVSKGDCIRVFNGHSDYVLSVRFIDQVIISASKDQSMMIWKPENEKAIRKITDDPTGVVYDICMNSDESMIACAYKGLTLYSWPDMNVVRRVDVNSSQTCFHPSNPDILAVNDNNEFSVKIYHIKNNELIRTFKGHSDYIMYLLFSIIDGYRVISTSVDKTTRIWDTSDI